MEENGVVATELLGQHRYQLDAKGRISLPARFRQPLSEGVYLTLGVDGCLFVFPKAQWEQQSRQVQTPLFAGSQARASARMFFANAERIDLDAQGRLVIPQKLRAAIGLERETVVIGVRDRLEIWPSEVWDRYEQSSTGAYTGGTLEPERA